MSDPSFTVMALAGVVLLLTGMVMIFAHRTPWLAPFRDPRIGELIAEVKALRARVAALAETQERVVRLLESAEARGVADRVGKP